MSLKGESLFGNSIWDRRGSGTSNVLSRRLYLLMVCFWTAAGVAFSAITSTISQDWPIQTWGGWDRRSREGVWCESPANWPGSLLL